MIDAILAREGGFVDHPADDGGPTKYGITQKTLSAYLGYSAMRSDVENLSEDLARDIYESRYYLGPRIDRLPQDVQPFVLDSAVNHGPRRAIKFVQSVCNQAGCKPQIDEDGVMGPGTRRAVEWAHASMGEYFLKALIEERKNFYYLIVRARPSQKVFFNGWMNRIKDFEQEVA